MTQPETGTKILAVYCCISYLAPPDAMAGQQARTGWPHLWPCCDLGSPQVSCALCFSIITALHSSYKQQCNIVNMHVAVLLHTVKQALQHWQQACSSQVCLQCLLWFTCIFSTCCICCRNRQRLQYHHLWTDLSSRSNQYSNIVWKSWLYRDFLIKTEAQFHFNSFIFVICSTCHWCQQLKLSEVLILVLIV